MIFHYFCALGSNTIPLSKCTAHTFDQLVRSIVFDLCIDVHCNLAALMACQILNRFGIYRRMNQVRDICVPQLMRCYLKVQAVNHFPIVSGLFPQNRCNRMLHTLSIFISVIYPLLCCSGNDILPKPLKLRVRQRITITIWNNILRSGICLCFSQAVCQADGERNVSFCGMPPPPKNSLQRCTFVLSNISDSIKAYGKLCFSQQALPCAYILRYTLGDPPQ